MKVRSVEFRNWRNISECAVCFSDGINVLWGMNAQGKSNILEGIYYFARGRSFRGAKEREMICFGCDSAAVKLTYLRDGFENDTTLEAFLSKSGKKKLHRNGAPLSSSSEMMGSFRAVLFSPANLCLVTGGPLERRTFLDIAISQLSPSYLTYLRHYTKTLAERNALIKSCADGYSPGREEWDVYAEQLAEYGVNIAAYRSDYTAALADAVSRYFDGMTDGAEKPRITYSSHVECSSLPHPMTSASPLSDEELAALSEAKEKLRQKLGANIEREIAAGTTLWGIHKDDISLMLNGREAKLFASQGQQRSIALSMKLAEAEIAHQVGGEYPVILLDDVFSELDEKRRRFVLEALTEDNVKGQIIITSCEPDVIPERSYDSVTFRHIENGGLASE